jgi:NSS family neurotransmitter:Na+ symporter
MAGEYGGGAFVIVYLFTVLFVGFSVLASEIAIGYLGKSDAVNSFKVLRPEKSKIKWEISGFAAFTGLIIMTFYSVVIGWILYYLVNALYFSPQSIEEAKEHFEDLTKNKIWFTIFFHSITAILVGFVVTKGIKKGIEATNKIFMPLLVIIIAGLLTYASTLDGFGKSLSFMFSFDFSKLNSEAIIQAVGHSFFTLSVGMAVLLTYASSLPKDTNIFKATFYIVFLDTFIAILSGIMLYTFVFEFGQEVASGPGLVFISIPVVFAQMGMLGTVFAILFFLALAFAGFTSAISLVEPSVMYAIDKFKISRKNATVIMVSIFFLIGVLVILSDSLEYKEMLTIFNLSLFNLLDKLTTNILLPLGALSIAIFVGFVIPKQKLHEVMSRYVPIWFFNIWYFSIRYIAIIAITFTLLNLIGVIKI